MSPRALPLSLAVALAACGARRPDVRSVAPGPSPRAAATPAVIHVLPPVERRDERLRFEQVAGIAGCDGAHGVSADARAEVRGGEVVLSEPGPAVSAEATPTEGGWVFHGVGDDAGSLYASERFTGALRRIGRMPAHAELTPYTRGRAVLLDDVLHALWTCDGRVVTAVTSLPGPVASAAFDDALRGAAVLVDGTLHETRDGGATWRSIPLGADLALRVSHDGRALRVATNRAWMTLDDGALRPDTQPEPVCTSDQHLARMAAAREALDATTSGDVAWLRGGGRVVVRGHGAITVVTAAGAVRRGRTRRDCDRVAAWGGDAIARCGDGLRVRADGRVFLIETPAARPFPRGAAVYSDDGAHAAFEGPCAERGEDDPQDVYDDSAGGDLTQVCVLDDTTHTWRTVDVTAVPDIPHGDSMDAGVAHRLVAMRGATLIVRSEGDEGFYTLDTERGAAAPVAIPATDGVSWRLVDLGVTGDGLLAGVAVRTDRQGETRMVVVGPRVEALTTREAPPGATRVAFADASRGIAQGESPDTLWRTVDGGATWEPLRIPHDAVSDDDTAPQTLACGADGCSIGDRVRIEGWGPLPPPTDPEAEAEPTAEDTMSDSDLPPAPEATPAEWIRPDVSYDCAVGAWRPTPWTLPDDMSQDAAPEAVHAWGRTAITRRTANGVTTEEIAWWSPGGRGALSSSRGPDLSRLLDDIGWVGRDTLLRARPAALARWRDGRLEPIALPWLPEGSPVRLGAGWRVAPQRDGGLVVAVEASSPGMKLDMVMSLDASWTPRAVRLYPGGEARALIGAQGRWGLGRPAVGEALRMLPMDGAADAPLTLPVWNGSLSPCVGDVVEDDATVDVDSGRDGSLDGVLSALVGRQYGYSQHERARFDLSPRGECLRAISGAWRGMLPRQPPRDTMSTYFVSLSSRRGALEGFVDDGARRAAMRCVVPRALHDRGRTRSTSHGE